MRRTGFEATVIQAVDGQVDEAAEEPAVLIVNWPNFVGPCLYCSGKHRLRAQVQTEIKNA